MREREAADIYLGNKTVMAEQFMLMEYLLGNFLRASDKEAMIWIGKLFEVAKGYDGLAAAASHEVLAVIRVIRIEFIPCLLRWTRRYFGIIKRLAEAAVPGNAFFVVKLKQQVNFLRTIFRSLPDRSRTKETIRRTPLDRR